MKWAGFYNYSPSSANSFGTEVVTGTSSSLPVVGTHDTVSPSPNHYFFGSFANLGTIDMDLVLTFWDGSKHTHDLRAYEEFVVRALPIKYVDIIVNGTTAVHGMGWFVYAENEQDQRALMIQAEIYEDMKQGRHNTWNVFKNATASSATTTDVWTAASGKTQRMYKISVSSAGANNVTFNFTDSSNTNVNEIFQVQFAGQGTFVFDTDINGLDNPQLGGKIRMVTSTTAAVNVDIIGLESNGQ